MTLFFFISGLFAPSSLDKKGVKTFLRERTLRLGLPLAFYFFIISPCVYVFIHLWLDTATWASIGQSPLCSWNTPQIQERLTHCTNQGFKDGWCGPAYADRTTTKWTDPSGTPRVGCYFCDPGDPGFSGLGIF